MYCACHDHYVRILSLLMGEVDCRLGESTVEIRLVSQSDRPVNRFGGQLSVGNEESTSWVDQIDDREMLWGSIDLEVDCTGWMIQVKD